MSTGKFGVTSIKNGVLRKKHQLLTTLKKGKATFLSLFLSFG